MFLTTLNIGSLRSETTSLGYVLQKLCIYELAHQIKSYKSLTFTPGAMFWPPFIRKLDNNHLQELLFWSGRSFLSDFICIIHVGSWLYPHPNFTPVQT